MKLDASEKDFLDSVEKGEWRSARGLEQERRRYSSYAAATFRKNRRVNIRNSGCREFEAAVRATSAPSECSQSRSRRRFDKRSQ
jgi:hypothetical protein